MRNENRQHWIWAGFIAFVWFSLLVIGLAALRPEYQHAHKAISELGAIDAPYMLVMNTFGFIGTGLLMAMFAVGYRSIIGEQAAGYKALLITALFFALTALPIAMRADGDPDRESSYTMVHLVFVMLVPAPWLWAMISIFQRYRKGPFRVLAIISIFAFIVLTALTAYRMLGPDTNVPGLWQRASFAVFLGWYAIAAFLLQSARQSDLQQVAP